jgi:hypothetical protein
MFIFLDKRLIDSLPTPTEVRERLGDTLREVGCCGWQMRRRSIGGQTEHLA